MKNVININVTLNSKDIQAIKSDPSKAIIDGLPSEQRAFDVPSSNALKFVDCALRNPNMILHRFI